MTQPTPRLGDAIAPPKRDLQGAFGRKKTPRPAPTVPPTARPAATGDEKAHDQAPTSTGATPEAAPASPNASPAASGGVDKPPAPGVTVGRTVFLTDEIFTLVRNARLGPDRRTSTKVVLDALTATHTRLPQLIAEDLAPKVIKGSLFEEVISTPAAPAKRSLRIEPTQQQLAVIDQLVETTGAKDRSHMLSVALKAYLDT